MIVNYVWDPRHWRIIGADSARLQGQILPFLLRVCCFAEVEKELNGQGAKVARELLSIDSLAIQGLKAPVRC